MWESVVKLCGSRFSNVGNRFSDAGNQYSNGGIVGIGGIATMMGGKDDFAEGKAASTRMIKDSHLTQSDLKLKHQLAMYEGEEQESPDAGKISQATGLEVN